MGCVVCSALVPPRSLSTWSLSGGAGEGPLYLGPRPVSYIPTASFAMSILVVALPVLWHAIRPWLKCRYPLLQGPCRHPAPLTLCKKHLAKVV
jgi:hypothetical protein